MITGNGFSRGTQHQLKRNICFRPILLPLLPKVVFYNQRLRPEVPFHDGGAQEEPGNVSIFLGALETLGAISLIGKRRESEKRVAKKFESKEVLVHKEIFESIGKEKK